MKWFTVSMTALVAVTTSLAQDPIRAPVRTKPDSKQMAEDIEVMRRLLMRSSVSRVISSGMDCLKCHAAPMTFRFQQGAASDVARFLGSAYQRGAAPTPDAFWLEALSSAHHPHVDLPPLFMEGLHLPGHGVVFQMVLPPERDATKKSKATPARLPSDWEIVQKQLRGDAPAKSEPAEAPSLSDSLLRTLAENGKNFRELPADERITIEVTFRKNSALRFHGDEGTGTAATAPPGPGPVGGPPGAGSIDGSPEGPPGSPDGAGNTGGDDPFGTGATKAGRDQELLGDLHAKQNKFDAAVAEYERALKIVSAVANDPSKRPADLQNRIKSLQLKLAQAYLSAGKVENARKVLELAVDASKRPAAKPPDSATATSKLPAKLRISATKKVLDAVGAGKLSFDEFRKQATVELSE